MRQPTNLRELPAIRDNRLFPVPVRAYDPSNRPELPEGPKLPDLPDLPAPEDFRRWGLEFTGEYTAEATPAGLSYSLPVFQDQGERWLVREHQGHPPLRRRRAAPRRARGEAHRGAAGGAVRSVSSGWRRLHPDPSAPRVTDVTAVL